jgi:hypothetical protein
MLGNLYHLEWAKADPSGIDWFDGIGGNTEQSNRYNGGFADIQLLQSSSLDDRSYRMPNLGFHEMVVFP